HAQDFAVELAEPAVEITEIARFAGAAGRRVPGVEVNHDPFSAQRFEVERAAIVERRLQCGYALADADRFRVAHVLASLSCQNFIGSMIASRLSPSQNSRTSSRSAARCIEPGMPTVICAENMSAPVCMAR